MDLFAEASEISEAGKRAAFLDAVCAGDEALRARVEQLLDAHDQVGSAAGFLGGPDGPDGHELEPAEVEGAGGSVGRYKLLQRIGEGGWGIVYMAEQTVPVRRRVALKIIKPGMDSRQVLARFEAERQALAMMDHPNIARVLDAGATENGRPYFVMELVRGIPITDYCDKNRLTMPQRLDLFIQVCQAVQHAHQKGIIHRDIKPSNILVTSDDGKPVPKVIDFGVAKATTDLQLTDKTLFTRFEMFVGTPAYMSPEQAEFSAQGVDTRTDIYALGVLLYELLTGQTPFDGRTLISSGVDAMRRTIREQEPPKPSTRLRLLEAKTVETVAAQRQTEQQRLVESVRGDLDWIVLKALEKDRTRRYETANGLAMDVHRFLSSEPVSARPPHALYVFRKWSRRHRAAFAGGAAVLGALVLGVLASTWLAVRAMKAEQTQRDLRAKSDVDRAAADAARNEAVTRAYAADMKAVAVALAEGNSGHANALLDRYLPRPDELDVRGFEWTILRNRAAGDETASFDQTGMNAGVAAAPDGSWVAGAEKFGPVRVWDARSGRLLHEFPAMKQAENRKAVAVSPDGSLLAYLSDTSVWVRGTRDWEVRRELPGLAFCVAFTPDGSLVWAGPDKMQIVNPQSFTVDLELAGIALGVSTMVSFSRDSRRMAVVNREDDLEVWDIERRVRMAKLGVKASSVALSPDGGTLAVGDGSGSLSLWDAESGRRKQGLPAHEGWLLDVVWSADGTRLITAGGDQMIRQWDLAGGALPEKASGHWRGHWNEVWSVAFAGPDSLISGGKDGKVKLWPRTAGSRGVVSIPVPEPCQQNGYLRGGALVCVRRERKLLFFHTKDGSPAGEWQLPVECPEQFELRRGDEAWFGDTAGAVRVYQLPEGRLLRTIRGPGDPAELVGAVSSDGSLLAVKCQGTDAVDVIRVSDGAPVARLPDVVARGGNPLWSRMSFSPDGRRIAYAARGRRCLVFDLVKKSVDRELREFAWHVLGVLWSPDGKALVTSCWDGAVAVWDPETGRRTLPVLQGHFAGVPGLTFSPDGRTLVTQGTDGTVRFWNIATGTEVLTLHDARCYWGCPVSPDSRTLFWQRRSDRVFQVETAR